jgi:hypothetical protein
MPARTIASRLSLPNGVVIILLLAATIIPARAATYYVSKSGSDSNACTQSAPCLTIAKGATKATQPGDIVQVGAGTYSERITVTTSGSASGKITFRGHDGSGCPTTVNSDVNSPTGTRPAPTVTMQGWDMRANYIAIDCFKIMGNNSPALDFANSTGKTDIDFTNNYIDGSNNGPWVGFNSNISGTLTNGPKNIFYARNYIYGTQYGTMVFCQANCVFQDNELERMMGGPLNTDHDYNRVFGEYVTYRHNYMHGNQISDCADPVNRDCHIDGWQTWNIGNAGEFARHITIDRNVAFNAHEIIIARDTSSGTLGSYTSHYDWTVTNNVFGYGPIGDSNAWCAAFEHIGQVLFYNNICTNTSLVGYMNGAQGTHKNNIHYSAGWQPYSANVSSWNAGSMTSSNNLLYESGRTYTGFSGDILNQNPLFVSASGNNYRIQSGSPAIDRAASVGVTADLDGKTRPIGSGPDIGPYEFGTSSTTTVQPPTSVLATGR